MSTKLRHISKLDQAVAATKKRTVIIDDPYFAIYDKSFEGILGSSPSIDLALEKDWPFAHEAGIYVSNQDAVFFTSNRTIDGNLSTVKISKLSRESKTNEWSLEELASDLIDMPNGGINYGSSNELLFLAQGSKVSPGGVAIMASKPPYTTRMILNNYHGREFNSPNDVVVHSDGSIWFTDPIYGSEQGFKNKPQLPSQIYRFDPATGDVRAMVDGLGRPNGLCFSPDEETLYVTDTDWIHGDGTTDDTRASTIYAFDIVHRHNSPFLANKRLFAMADTGIPDGIKCDLAGNVYSGCGDGVNVWSPGGILIGKIVIPGGVANFCFARNGELVLLNETRVWVVKVSKGVQGALLKGMGIEVD